MHSNIMVNVSSEEEANIDETSNKLPSRRVAGRNTKHTLNTDATIASNQSPIHCINLYIHFREQENPSSFTFTEPASNGMRNIGMNMYCNAPHLTHRTHAQYPQS
jgi:hypothetical protein